MTADLPIIFRQAQRLIKRGQIDDLRRALDVRLNPNLSDQFSLTLLMLAALSGNTSIGELLILRGADLARSTTCGDTALSLAAQTGHARFVDLLISAGASVECRPHGLSLEDWLSKFEPALPKRTMTSILKMIVRRRLH